MHQHEIGEIVFFVCTILSVPNAIALYFMWRHTRYEKQWHDMWDGLRERRLKVMEMLTTFGFSYQAAEVKDINVPCNEMKEGELIVQIIGKSTHHKDVIIRLNFSNPDFATRLSQNTQADYLKEYLLHIERLQAWELKPWRSVCIKGKRMGNVWMDLHKGIPKPPPHRPVS